MRKRLVTCSTIQGGKNLAMEMFLKTDKSKFHFIEENYNDQVNRKYTSLWVYFMQKTRWALEGKQKLRRRIAAVGFVTASIVAAIILSGCSTLSSESIAPDGTSTTQTISIPPWGKSDLANLSTKTESPTEGGGVHKHEMITGAEGTSGSDLSPLVDLIGLLATQRIAAQQLEVSEPAPDDTWVRDLVERIIAEKFGE